jgi:hypothetical protein
MPRQVVAPLPAGATSQIDAAIIKTQQQSAAQQALIGKTSGGSRRRRGRASSRRRRRKRRSLARSHCRRGKFTRGRRRCVRRIRLHSRRRLRAHFRGGAAATIAVPPVPPGAVDKSATAANYKALTQLAETQAAQAALDKAK